MLETMIEWDGTHMSSELPPGRYVVTPVDDDIELTPEEDAGIRAALDEADAGLGRDFLEVMEELRVSIRDNKWS